MGGLLTMNSFLAHFGALPGFTGRSGLTRAQGDHAPVDRTAWVREGRAGVDGKRQDPEFPDPNFRISTPGGFAGWRTSCGARG